MIHDFYLFLASLFGIKTNYHFLGKALISAISEANVKKAKLILSVGADPNYIDREEFHTALGWSVRSGLFAAPELISLLMRHGADPNLTTKNSEGETSWSPLMAACIYGETESIIAILDSDGLFKVNILARECYRSNFFTMPSMVIVGKNNSVELMSRMQIYFEENVLSGQNTDKKYERGHLWLSPDEKGVSAFMRSSGIENMRWILNQNFETPEKLLERTDNEGQTALWISTFNEEKSSVEFLLACGASMDGVNSYGQKIVEVAGDYSLIRKNKDSREIFKFLLAASESRKDMASIEQIAKQGQENHSSSAGALTEKYPENDPKKEQRSLNDTLIAAILAGNYHESKQLLVAGADPNSQDKDDHSALRLATKSHRFCSFEFINMLMKHGANPNFIQPFNQWSIFSHVCQSGKNGNVLAMLNANWTIKIDLLTTDKQQRTPAMFVSSSSMTSTHVLDRMQQYFEEQVLSQDKSGQKFERGHLWLSVDVEGKNSFMHCDDTQNMQWIIDQEFIQIDELMAVTNKKGKSSLWEAVEQERTHIVKFLLNHGAKIDEVDLIGHTLLEMAEIKAMAEKNANSWSGSRSREIFSHLKAVDASRKALLAIEQVINA